MCCAVRSLLHSNSTRRRRPVLCRRVLILPLKITDKARCRRRLRMVQVPTFHHKSILSLLGRNGQTATGAWLENHGWIVWIATLLYTNPRPSPRGDCGSWQTEDKAHTHVRRWVHIYHMLPLLIFTWSLRRSCGTLRCRTGPYPKRRIPPCALSRKRARSRVCGRTPALHPDLVAFRRPAPRAPDRLH